MLNETDFRKKYVDLGTQAYSRGVPKSRAMADTELEERLRDAETRARDAEAMMMQVLAMLFCFS